MEDMSITSVPRFSPSAAPRSAGVVCLLTTTMSALDLGYRRTFDEITLSIESDGDSSLEFAPALSPRARVIGAEFQNRRVAFQISRNSTDQHAAVHVSLPAGRSTLRIRLRDDFGLSYANVLPELASLSRGLRITSESWSRARDTLTLNAVGAGGSNYQLGVWNPAQVASVDGAEIRNGKLVLSLPSGSEAYPSKKIVIHFVKAG